MPISQYDEGSLTWRPNKEQLKRPIYRSLIKQLEKDILAGRISKNTRLPSQRELADFLDINFTTVGQAYHYGIEKGILYTNIGSGTYVSQNALHHITISTNNVADYVIDFGLVSSFEACNQYIVPHLQAVSRSKYVLNLLNYREPLGSPEQLKTAQHWLRQQRITTPIKNIALVAGVQNGIAITLAAIFAPGDRIATDRYTYANFIELANLFHLEIVPIDADEEGMRPDLLAMECKKKKINGIFLMPSCNNPTGQQISEQRRYELAAIIRHEKLWVLEDDIHAFLTNYFQPEILPPFQAILPEQTIYFAGMTKFLCSGLRIAYLVMPEAIRPQLEHSVFNINVKTSSFDAEVLTQVINSPTAAKILTEKFTMTRDANKLFDDFFQLPRPSNPYPYYRNIPVRTTFSQQQIEQDFLNKGVRVFHSARFTTQQQADPFIRIALSSTNLGVLDKGLQIIKDNIACYLRED
ncbi:aminotransferase-like domain-containing protein [Lapidilactobacillus bayanensis]|uniref:aminotransferase-like domain-containing protein n=1 Tax=Lapidilactobacillus bayanensis TaxID=2485998 RepID=UPI000F7B2725|nr:PLP-dependent aminotransferase family protein [Lapidilactobacillus bayanensis]